MTAYVIAGVRLTGDASELAAYRSAVTATLEPYNGRYLVRTHRRGGPRGRLAGGEPCRGRVPGSGERTRVGRVGCVSADRAAAQPQQRKHPPDRRGGLSEDAPPRPGPLLAQ
jgi:Domain of unknown function (DUF1330)